MMKANLNKSIISICYYFSIAVLLSLWHSNLSQAEDPNQFFEKNSALTTFSESVTISESPRVIMLKPWKKVKTVETAAEDPETAENPQKAALKQNLSAQLAEVPEQKADNADENNEKVLSASEKLLEKYGDPGKDAAVLATDNAPKPFQGMMAALDSGDEKLAFQYARQYVRHMRNLQERSEKVMSFTGLAMEKEGLAAGSGFDNNPEFIKDQQALEDKLLNGTASENSKDSTEKSLKESTAKQLIAKARSMDTFEDSSKNVETNRDIKEIDEATLRFQARQALSTKTPRDPSGAAEIYFFFLPQDQKAIAMVKEIQKIQALSKKIPKINVYAFTIRQPLAGELESFRLQANSTLNLSDGKDYAKLLGIKSSPTTVILAPTTGNALIEEGYRPFYYLDEAIALVQGRVIK